MLMGPGLRLAFAGMTGWNSKSSWHFLAVQSEHWWVGRRRALPHPPSRPAHRKELPPSPLGISSAPSMRSSKVYGSISINHGQSLQHRWGETHHPRLPPRLLPRHYPSITTL